MQMDCMYLMQSWWYRQWKEFKNRCSKPTNSNCQSFAYIQNNYDSLNSKTMRLVFEFMFFCVCVYVCLCVCVCVLMRTARLLPKTEFYFAYSILKQSQIWIFEFCKFGKTLKLFSNFHCPPNANSVFASCLHLFATNFLRTSWSELLSKSRTEQSSSKQQAAAAAAATSANSSLGLSKFTFQCKSLLLQLLLIWVVHKIKKIKIFSCCFLF